MLAETLAWQGAGVDAAFGSISVGLFLTQPSAGPASSERLLVLHVHGAINLPADTALSFFAAAKTTREIQAKTPLRACTPTVKETRHPLWNTKCVGACVMSCWCCGCGVAMQE